MKFLILALTFFSINLLAKDYFIDFHAKNIINEKHDYSQGNYYNILKLDGSFTDSLGNYGNFNALASVELNNRKIKLLKVIVWDFCALFILNRKYWSFDQSYYFMK